MTTEMEKRADFVDADKKALSKVSSKIKEFLSAIVLPDINTDEAAEITASIYGQMQEVINKFEKSLTELV